MATTKYRQEMPKDEHQPFEIHEPHSLTVQTLSDTLENATRGYQTDRHPARTAAFATNELLCLILSNVPNAANLIRVSKIWNSVLRNDIRYHTQPVNAIANNPMSIPMYPRSVSGRIDFNPIIHCWCDRRRNMWSNQLQTWTMVFRVDNYYPSVLHRFGNQYLTNPPITHLSFMASHGFKGALASLRVKDGIRLRDVAEVLDKLRQSVPEKCRFLPESKNGFQDYVFFAKLFCARAGSQREIRQRWDRMHKKVRGWRDSFDLSV
jgi:hypothetical protein